MRDIRELKYMQSLPLERKIEMTAERIDGWYQHYDGNVAVSFSGGKDSTVLLDIARNHWRGHQDIKAVFVDTGLEYPEIRQFVKTFDNVDIIRPAMRFDEVIKKYGYPVISKEVCESLYQAKKYLDGGGKKETYRLKKLRGKLKDKNDNTSLFNQKKYEPLLYVNFYCSNICCNVMKKQPSHLYSKKYRCFFITAEMACESKLRQHKWLQNGCNGFDLKNPKSTPMAFWTEQDVLEYIYKNNLPVAEPYGKVIETECQLTFDGDQCKYETTGCNRTGCMFCAFGLHLEKGKTRFQLLKETHPKQYEYCINGGEFVNGIWQPNKKGLGLGYVFDEINKIYGEDFIRYE